MSDIVIIKALRSPIGRLNGALASLSAVELATAVAKEAIAQSHINPNDIDNVIFGNVLQAGSGQNVARQIAIHSQLPVTTPAMTINEVCGSGLKSIILGVQSLKLNDATVALVGGTESMSNAPYLQKTQRAGARYGHQQLLDSILHDGLTDAFTGDHMGITAENVAEQFHISRQEQDAFALQSHQKASANQEMMQQEIVPITIKTRKGDVVVSQDEGIRHDLTIDALAKLKPVFKSDGTVTAGNASSINDGAAVLLLTTRQYATTHNLDILASIVDYAEVGNDPNYMGYAPFYAVEKLCQKSGLTIDQFDCIESNEAFAAQSLAVAKNLNFDITKVNRYGGAIALGHPIGASGSRIVVSLLTALKETKGTYGLATLCVGGGIGVALAIKNEQN